jgi:dTMP kinase
MAASASSPSSRGLFFLFEGVDRCGKTTQARRLCEALAGAGERCELLRFPDRASATGALLDRYLQRQLELDDRAVHLLFSANRWEASARLAALLRAGVHVVVDRYAHSGVCFSSAKPARDALAPPNGAALSLEWCKAPDAGLPMPDVLLFMDIPLEKAAARGGFGGERYETPEMQAAVRLRFAALRAEVEAVGAAVPGASEWANIDAAGTIDDVGAHILALAQRAVAAARAEAEAGRARPMRALWQGDVLA